MSKKDILLQRIREHGKLSTAEQLHLTALLSIPAILAQISSVLMFYIDDAMVGSLGANASAAVGLVATSLWLFWSIISCVATGFSVQVAHRIGANDFDGARSVFRQSIIIGLCISAATATVGVAIARHLPYWLGGSEEIAADAGSYFMVFCLGTPLALYSMLMSAMLRCAGNMKVPSLSSILMCLLDVGFNFIAIFPTRVITIDLPAVSPGLTTLDITIPGLGLGVTGAALGTILAEGTVAAYVTWYAVVRSKELRIWHTSGSFKPQPEVMHKAVSIAGPILVQRVLMNVAQITITVIVAPLGAIAIAANALGVTAESVCYMPGYGIGEAATTLIGQSIGAGRRRLTTFFAWMTTLIGIAVMTVMGAVMYMAAPLMMATLTPDADVQALGVECLRIEAWAEPMFAASIVAMSVFVGAGDTRLPALLNLFSMWAVRVTLAAMLAPLYGLQGVWLAMAIELTFRGIIFLIRMKRGRWLKITTYESRTHDE